MTRRKASRTTLLRAKLLLLATIRGVNGVEAPAFLRGLLTTIDGGQLQGLKFLITSRLGACFPLCHLLVRCCLPLYDVPMDTLKASILHTFLYESHIPQRRLSPTQIKHRQFCCQRPRAVLYVYEGRYFWYLASFQDFIFSTTRSKFTLQVTKLICCGMWPPITQSSPAVVSRSRCQKFVTWPCHFFSTPKCSAIIQENIYSGIGLSRSKRPC